MIIYNVTTHVEKSVNKEWLDWIKEHIPQVLGTGKFVSATFAQVLIDDDSGANTYSVQFKAPSRESLDAYYDDFADELRKDALTRFGDKVLSFRTELEIIDEFSVNFNWFLSFNGWAYDQKNT